MKIIMNLINLINRYYRKISSAFSYTDDEIVFFKQNGKSNHIF